MTTILVDIALIGWIPVILLVFTLLPARRAVIAAFLVGWCFLPVHGYEIRGFPEYNKQSATCVGVLLAAAAFDAGRLLKFRPRLVDLPMALWCIAPFISNTLGERGAYEGLSVSVQYIFLWGIPYFIGRLYLTDLAALRDLAMGLFIAGLAYSALCLYEIKMSPQLHIMLYGTFPHEDFGMTRRGGGWRPNVFMQHGLAVGLFMSVCAVVAVWVTMCRSVRTLASIPALALAAFLVVVAVLCKSTGATVLMLAGCGVLWATSLMRSRWVVRSLIAVPVVYIVSRTVGGWDAMAMVDIASYISEDRAGSLYWRLASENDCWNLVRPNAVFGFGYFGFAGVRLGDSNTAVTPDGMWLIALINNGLFGLSMFYAALLLPVIAFTRRLRPVHWSHPAVAPAASIAIIVVLYAIDNLFNAMPNPLFILAAGGLASTARAIPIASRAAPRAAPLPVPVHPPGAAAVPGPNA